MTATRPPLIRQPHEAETLTTPAVTMRLLVDADEAAGSVNALEVTLARGADGAAPHVHTRSDELTALPRRGHPGRSRREPGRVRQPFRRRPGVVA